MTDWINEKGIPSGKYALDGDYSSSDQMTHVPKDAFVVHRKKQGVDQEPSQEPSHC